VSFGQGLGLVSLIFVGYILWRIQQLLLLIFAAIVFATILNRFVGWLIRRWYWSRSQAIALTFGLILLLTILFFGLIVPPFIDQFKHLVQLFPSIWEKLRLIVTNINQRQAQWDWLSPLPSLSEAIDQLRSLSTPLFQNFFALFSNSFTAIGQFILVVILTLMMLVSPQSYRRRALQLIPSFYRRRSDEILILSEVALTSWLGGILFNCLFIGVLTGVGLALLQVKLVLVHALLAGVLNFIPNIGPTLSVVFPISVVLLDSPWKIGPILLWYFFIQTIESYWLTPAVMAKQVSLLPAVTLMAQLFFASIFGVLGLLLALPLTVVAKIWVEEILFKDILDCWQDIEPS
jgi:predicted PurR-regulated permease PerM